MRTRPVMAPSVLRMPSTKMTSAPSNTGHCTTALPVSGDGGGECGGEPDDVDKARSGDALVVKRGRGQEAAPAGACVVWRVCWIRLDVVLHLGTIHGDLVLDERVEAGHLVRRVGRRAGRQSTAVQCVLLRVFAVDAVEHRQFVLLRDGVGAREHQDLTRLNGRLCLAARGNGHTAYEGGHA